jgi:hypothetical protein
MARFGWFIAGAAAAAGALVSAPRAYERLREAIGAGVPAQLPPGDWPEGGAVPADEPDPAPSVAATPGADGEDTQEIRLRIQETRERIQRRAHEAAAAESHSDAED